jgi:hypothetical protein
MKGELVLVDNVFSKENEFELSTSAQDFCLNIYVDEENTFEKQIKNKKSFNYCMSALEEFWSIDGEVSEERLKEKQYITEHFDNLMDSIEFIRLSFEELDNVEFIKNNPLVLTKKIDLSEMLDITDYEKLMKLMNKYNDIADKIYVSLTGNTNYVSLMDCYKTMSAIKNQADDVKQLGLSPIETIMYVYDQVRNRVYTFENEDELCFKSRDLSEVMFGDKIVCAGYANIFHVLLHYIGIENLVVHLMEKDNPKSGHARNVIYVKDDKYGIDGVYYFDPTWNSKRRNEINEYLYRYTYFAKTRKFMDDDKKYDFEDSFFPMYSVDMDKKIKKIIADGKYERLMPYTKSLNYMSHLVTHSSLINPMNVMPMAPMYGQFDIDEFLKKFEEVFSKFTKEIPAETMLKIFSNVRKVEYYQNPELYPYSLEDMYKTCIRSNWQFADKHLDARAKMLQRVFGEKIELEEVDNFKNYGHESGLFNEVQQVRLAKILRLVCDKKIKQ